MCVMMYYDGDGDSEIDKKSVMARIVNSAPEHLIQDEDLYGILLCYMPSS